MRNVARRATFIMIIGLIIFGAYTFINHYYNQPINKVLKNNIQEIEANNKKDDIEIETSTSKLLDKKDVSNEFEDRVDRYSGITPRNILVIGVDTPDVEDLKVGKNGSTGVRTDTIMLVRVEDDGKMKILSIPRDSRVELRGKLDKINHAHSFGGIDMLVDTIYENFDISIDRYVRVDYKAVKSIVNSIGGVEVEIDRNMRYVDATPDIGIDIDFEPGTHLLDGDDALRFLRFRSYPEGDLGRVDAQQYFLKQLGQKVFDKGVIKVGKTFIENNLSDIDTNLSLGEIMGLLKKVKNSDMEDVEFKTLKGEGKYIKKVSYFLIDEDNPDLDIYR